MSGGYLMVDEVDGGRRSGNGARTGMGPTGGRGFGGRKVESGPEGALKRFFGKCDFLSYLCGLEKSCRNMISNQVP